jgi:MFS family permease
MINPDKAYYYLWFFTLLIMLVIAKRVLGGTKESAAAIVTSEFKRFQHNYLLVYLVVMGADWLQGPYVYALYQHYHFTISEIGALFVAGFGASAVFGAVAGIVADKYGRKKMCLAFCVMYSLACITKHFPSYPILMVGRILGGISTSILFSAFEAWMIHEHHDKAYVEDWLGQTYAICTSGNAIIAIAAGMVASFARDAFGPVAPFDVSLIFLVVGAVIISMTWRENYGDASIDLSTTLSNAWERIKQDKKVALLGAVQSLFEGAMYIFVFMWTPALESSSDVPLDHGWIFASFMLCVSLGSDIFKYFFDTKQKVEKTSVYLFAVSTAALGLPIFTKSHSFRLVSFFVFEICVGMFWPSISFLRSHYIPEEVRTTVMNIFRIPLNIIVVIVLFNIGKLSETHVFMCCMACLVPAMLCQMELVKLTVESPDIAKKGTTEEEDKEPLAAILTKPKKPDPGVNA